jgi:hypothetical protein
MTFKNINSEKFQTGDLLLFKYTSFIGRFIEYFTSSNYSHCGIIIKNPSFGPDRMDGIYILESTGLDNIPDGEDNEIKFGVQLRKLEDVYSNFQGTIYYRQLHCNRNEQFYNKLKHAHSIVHNRPYDANPLHWIRAKYKTEIGNLQNKNTFFCSALVSFVYMTLGLLPLDTKWSMCEPCQLGTETDKNNLRFINCTFDNEIIIN